MNQPCQLGFECPYHHVSEEGDEICTYPYIRITQNEESETFGFPDEQDCPLLDWTSDLYRLMYAYEMSDKVRAVVDEESIRLEEENHKVLDQLIDDVFGDEKK